VVTNGIWKYHKQMGKAPYLGFVYLVHDTWANRYYIGKKSYKVKKGQSKGEEAAWKSYKTSCKELKDHLAARPLSEFEFIVLGEYRTFGGLAWAETYLQTLARVPLSPYFYNTRLEGISFKVNEDVNKETVSNWNAFWKDRRPDLVIWEQ
jgi:hypothetical protein